MGRNAQPLKINEKKMFGKRKGGACMEEMTAFFTCMMRSGDDSGDNCEKERKALAVCADLSANKLKVKSTLNYHLARLGRIRK